MTSEVNVFKSVFKFGFHFFYESRLLILSSHFSDFCFYFLTLLSRNIGRCLCFHDIRVFGFHLTPFCWLLLHPPHLLHVCALLIKFLYPSKLG